MKTYQIIKFQDGDFTLDVSVSPEDETVWLSKEELAELFDRDRPVIGKHINNIFKEGELSREISCANFAHKIGDQTTQY